MRFGCFSPMRKRRTAGPMTVQPAHPWVVQPIAEPAGKRPSPTTKMSPAAADLLRKQSLKKQRALIARAAPKRGTAKGLRAH